MYIDDRFYQNKMKEMKDDRYNADTKKMAKKSNSSNYKSYPVKIIALRVNWILNEDEGKEFLEAIYASEGLDIFKNESVVMLIEYLYSQYKVFITKWFVTFNVLQLLIFELSIVSRETNLIHKVV